MKYICLELLITQICMTLFIHIVILNLIQNSQAVKKVCGPQKGYGEKKDVKSKVAAKKWL